MSASVHVVNAGVISAIGNNLAENIRSFENHRSGIGAIQFLETRHHHVFPLGEVKLSNSELAANCGLPEYLSRTILLSFTAAREALSVLMNRELENFRTGFISASTVGGMDKTEFFYRDFNSDPMAGDLRQVMHHDNGKPTDYVAKELGLKGFVTTISTACSSSANAIMLGSRMIRAGKLDIVVAGGVDALTRFTLNGFNTLMIVDKNQCRPLDESREGLNLGEGAAYLILMSDEALKKTGLQSWCNVSGYCNANDSHHQTALSDDGNGPYLAMKGALEMAQIQPSDIDYINMHGTGTKNNDSAEGKAVERIFHPHYPKLSSTKSFTGHTLGASGGIEAAYSAIALRDGLIYPNFTYSQPVSGLHIVPETKFIKGQQLNHVLSNSFGFGGNCTSLVFSSL
jgi:3-oxoacyl-[acyl-carrier-protein] synthase-1